MGERLIADHRVRLAVGALLFASGLSVTMLVARTLFAGHLQLGFYLCLDALTHLHSSPVAQDAATEG